MTRWGWLAAVTGALAWVWIGPLIDPPMWALDVLVGFSLVVSSAVVVRDWRRLRHRRDTTQQ